MPRCRVNCRCVAADVRLHGQHLQHPLSTQQAHVLPVGQLFSKCVHSPSVCNCQRDLDSTADNSPRLFSYNSYRHTVSHLTPTPCLLQNTRQQGLWRLQPNPPSVLLFVQQHEQ
jgi:hypothetical protein